MQIRAQIGMAKAFHPVAMRREEQENLEEAVTLFESKEGLDFSGIWDGGDAEILFELASYYSLANRRDEAMEALRRAVELGWREAPRLHNEPTLETLRASTQMQAILAELSSVPPIA